MDLGIIFSGKFGERFVCNLAYPELCPRFGACGIDSCDFCKKYDFSKSISFVYELCEPSAMEQYIEEPEKYVQSFSCDVLVAINVHPDILLSLPKIGDLKALLVPACDQKWCSPGLRRQLQEKCESIGIEFSAPKPFCSLFPQGKVLKKFCDEFKLGRPEFSVKIEGNEIERVEVLRSDPCGSAYFVAKRMRGFVVESREELYKEIHQHQCAYPCMASMERDVELIEAPFHLAGYIMVYNFSKALGVNAEEFVPKHFRKLVLI